MKQEAQPPEPTEVELVGTRDKEYSGYFGKTMSVHYITIKVMKRGNSEKPKENLPRCSHIIIGRYGSKIKLAATLHLIKTTQDTLSQGQCCHVISSKLDKL